MAAYDRVTDKVVALFNPRKQYWYDHFNWSKTGNGLLERRPVDAPPFTLSA